jgi:hypothetical protein
MNLRQLRLHEGVHVETLAKRLNVTPSAVLGREAAPLRNLPLGTILEHCTALGLEVQVIATRRDGSKEPIQ